MKKWLAKGLSALLIAALMLTGTALMEVVPPAEEIPEIEEDTVAEDISVIEEIPTDEEDIEITVEPEEAEIAETEAALVEEAEEAEDIPAEEIVDEPAPLFAAEEAEPVAQEDEEESPKLMEGEECIPIDEAHFPDPAFRQYLLTHGGDGMGNIWPNTVYGLTLYEDLTAQYGEGAYVGYGITSLQGIEYFTNLKTLDCAYNTISVLDVSMLKSLERLSCSGCGLTSLNVSGCTSLWGLYAVKNAFTTLDISGCAAFAGFPSGYKRDTSALKKQGQIIYKTGKTRGGYTEGLSCDASVTIVCNGVSVSAKTGKKVTAAVPAVAAGFVEVAGKVPATVAVDPTSTAKNTRATAVAAPGSAMQLDLSGATGKKFKSSKKKVATVNKYGVVTFKKGGKVKITYKVGKQTRKVTLTVVDPTMPTAIALDQTGTVAAKKGDTVALTATMNEGAVSAIKWKSSNKKVAIVKNGVVTFKKAGKATITATTKRGKKKAKVTFAVAK